MLITTVVSIGGIIFLVALLGVVVLGVRFVARPADYIDVDLDARTFVHVRDHQRRDERPLDSLGTLVVTQRTRTVRSKNSSRTIVEYAVHPEGRADLDFRVVKDRGEARVILETLARRWKLPSAAWGGDVRQPDQLDLSLHERLRGSEEHRSALTIRPEWNLRVELLSPGYAIISSHRAWVTLLPGAILLIPFCYVALIAARGGFFSDLFGEGERDLVSLALGAGLILVLIGFAGWIARMLRDTFFPGTITVTPEGVSYRGRTMRFEELEEVIGADGIEFVGDRRMLKVAPTFCPPEAVPELCHELERMIIELAGAPRIG
jgi:hypothetical protein